MAPDNHQDVSHVGVIVVAAGSSSRMGGVDKLFAELRGVPVLEWSLRAFSESPAVAAIAVVLSEPNLRRGRELVESCGLEKVMAVVPGGARRQDSVRAGIEALDACGQDVDWLAVHDGARPFVDWPMLARGLAAGEPAGAAVAAVPVKDTIKVVDPALLVTSTPDRRTLWAVQTPQVFRAGLLRDAHARISVDVTDDASMVELAGGKVAVFEGHPENIKITTPDDLLLAEMIAARRAGEDPAVADAHVAAGQAAQSGSYEGSIRLQWGTGFDGHRLVPGGPLRLGGVDVPFEMHLEGHSDGDVLLHAIASALLGAVSLGDLGGHFPSSDPRYEGIDSAELLRQVVARVKNSGWVPGHVDATIIAQRPRLAPHVDRMATVIASTIGLDKGDINVKVTSTDGVGAIGAGDGIATQAVATLRQNV